MGKGDKTRQAILQKVAILFNQKGYAATSMQDITHVTGIQRGGIYNHFTSKEALAVETFEYACSVLGTRLMQGVNAEVTALGQLKAIATTFADLYIQNPLFPCGCQVLNTAVEAKRHMLPLRQKAQEAMTKLQNLIIEKTREAIEQGELPDSINIDALAAIFVSTLEGAMVLSVLYDDSAYLRHAVTHLHGHLDSLRASSFIE
ncbi:MULTISPECIES: TetR/AcrR family transcriptional regulator [unclassified Leptolyngbya]|uniref:TetR/AcrR family transcriptional regulator n=1 Tax=unclassified Leptolyngbya TaxID=2650499 RepID=UPI0016832DA2|nr:MULTISPECIES: TetR/AcrR family transcriptional regulator [unclassified Leptolyngbya]MBD1910349.1 TetR/AcrR family transcriptional regulator [Leptolyngbya sp. FACHB-8]MBD2154848.1 TetR/AcrR family transcriptional regulator [Leptolyngbya sp. FACHB-16]